VTEVGAEPADVDFNKIGRELEALGYSVLLLLVNNHTMLHSRAPFAGLRHMLRFRYDDPLHPAVILARCDT